MKKFLASILAIIYLSTSMGATVHMHYCMGKLIGWSLVDHSGKDCSFCGMENKPAPEGCTVAMKGCCRDEHHLIKSREDQKGGGLLSFELVKVPVTLAEVPYASWMSPFVISSVLARPVANAPPEADNVPVFLRNCNFRI
jgi:hypothetical protein